MASAVDQQAAPARPPRQPVLPAGLDVVVCAALALGLLLLYGPAYNELAHTVWATDEQGHGPIILVVSAWLLYVKRHELSALPAQPVAWLAWRGHARPSQLGPTGDPQGDGQAGQARF